jgi:CheY-like chemotaxis protein
MDHLDILLVEDNIEDAAWVDIQLKKSGAFSYTLQVCDYFSKALTVLKHRDFGLILLDLSLPDSNGLDSLKTLVKSTTIPVIIYTGISHKLVKEEAFKVGVADYLVKGETSVDTLKKCIADCMNRNINPNSHTSVS